MLSGAVIDLGIRFIVKQQMYSHDTWFIPNAAGDGYTNRYPLWEVDLGRERQT